jgi:AcrR family transcriptional regulator
MPVSESSQPKRRQLADAERNRLRLLEVARAAFASGEETVSLEQIARNAGVGIGTLYRHFPTRETLVEALYRQELDDLCASPAKLLDTLSPELALRAWMDRFRGYVIAKREMGETLRAVFASRTFTIPGIREELSAAVQQILEAGATDHSLRADVHAEDVVASVVGMCTATSLAGGHEQLERMLDLLVHAVRA